MLSKFLNNFNKKKQSRNKQRNIHKNWFLDANILTDNSTKPISQLKKMRKNACFMQVTDANFLLYLNQEIRNLENGIGSFVKIIKDREK